MYQCILSLFDKDILPWYDRIFPVKNSSSIENKDIETAAIKSDDITTKALKENTLKE